MRLALINRLRGQFRTREHGTLSWRAKEFREIEVWVWRGREEMLLGFMRCVNPGDYLGTLHRTLGVGESVYVTAGSEDDCVEKMVARWRDLDAERTRKEITKRSDLEAQGRTA